MVQSSSTSTRLTEARSNLAPVLLTSLFVGSGMDVRGALQACVTTLTGTAPSFFAAEVRDFSCIDITSKVLEDLGLRCRTVKPLERLDQWQHPDYRITSYLYPGRWNNAGRTTATSSNP